MCNFQESVTCRCVLQKKLCGMNTFFRSNFSVAASSGTVQTCGLKQHVPAFVQRPPLEAPHVEQEQLLLHIRQITWDKMLHVSTVAINASCVQHDVFLSPCVLGICICTWSRIHFACFFLPKLPIIRPHRQKSTPDKPP